jgi:hypothetical protein
VVGFRPQPLYPRRKSSWYLLNRKLGGPQAGLDYVEKRTYLTLLALNSEPSIVHSVASRYTDYALPAQIQTGEVRNLIHIIFWHLYFFEIRFVTRVFGCKRTGYVHNTTKRNALQIHMLHGKESKITKTKTFRMDFSRLTQRIKKYQPDEEK